MALGAKSMSLRLGVDYMPAGMTSLFGDLAQLETKLKSIQSLMALTPAGKAAVIQAETTALKTQNTELAKRNALTKEGIDLDKLRRDAIAKAIEVSQKQIGGPAALAQVRTRATEGGVSTQLTETMPGGVTIKTDVGAESVTVTQNLAKAATERERLRDRENGLNAAYQLRKIKDAETAAKSEARIQDVEQTNYVKSWQARIKAINDRNSAEAAANTRANTQNAQFQMARIKDDSAADAQFRTAWRRELSSIDQRAAEREAAIVKNTKASTAHNAAYMGQLQRDAREEDRVRTQMANQGYRTMMTEAQFQNRVMSEQARQTQNLQTVRAFRRQPGVEILPVQRTIADTGQMQNVVRLYNSSTGELLRYNVATKTASLSTKQLGEETARAGDTIQSSIGKVMLWSIATGAVYGTIRAMKGGLMAFAEMETATTALARTGRGFSSALDPVRQQFEMIAGAKNVTEEVLKLSVAFGVSADEAMQAAMTFSRLGLSQRETVEATKISIMAANVAYIDTATSAKLLASAMQQFGLSVRDLPALLDHLNTLENTTNVRTGEMLNAISRSGTVFRDAGGSLEQFIALTAVVAQATARSGAEIGNAFKTIASRLGSADVQMSVFKTTGVQIVDSFGNVKPVIQIMNEMSLAFDKMSDAQKNEAAISAAGVRQRNFFKVALDNIVEIQYKQVQMFTDVNSAAKENALVMETLTKKGQQVSAAFTRMSYEVGKGGAGAALGYFADSTRQLMGMMGDFPKLSVAIATGLAAYTLAAMTATSSGGQLTASITALKAGYVKVFVDIGNYIKFITAGSVADNTAALARELYTKQLIASGVAQELATIQASVATQEQLANAAATVGGFARVSFAIQALGKSLWSLLGWPTLIIVGIMAIAKAYDYLTGAAKRSIEAQEAEFKRLDEILKSRKQEADLVKSQLDLWGMVYPRLAAYQEKERQGIQLTSQELVKQARYRAYISTLGGLTGEEKKKISEGKLTAEEQVNIQARLNENAKNAAINQANTNASALIAEKMAFEIAEKRYNAGEAYLLKEIEREQTYKAYRAASNADEKYAILQKRALIEKEMVKLREETGIGLTINIEESIRGKEGKGGLLQLRNEARQRVYDLNKAISEAAREEPEEEPALTPELQRLKERQRIDFLKGISIEEAGKKAREAAEEEEAAVDNVHRKVQVEEAAYKAMFESLSRGIYTVQELSMSPAQLESMAAKWGKAGEEQVRKIRETQMKYDVEKTKALVAETEAGPEKLEEQLRRFQEARRAAGRWDIKQEQKEQNDLVALNDRLHMDSMKNGRKMQTDIDRDHARAVEEALRMDKQISEEKRRQAEQVDKMLGRMSDEELMMTAIYKGRIEREGIKPGTIDILSTTQKQRRDIEPLIESLGIRDFYAQGALGTHGFAAGRERFAEQEQALTPEQGSAAWARYQQEEERRAANRTVVGAAAQPPAGAAFSPAAQGLTVTVGNISGQFEQLAAGINARVTAGISATLATFLATVETPPKIAPRVSAPVRQ